MIRRAHIACLAAVVAAALAAPDLGARPGGGQSFSTNRSSSTPSSPSRASTPSSPSRPSTPSSPSFPSRPSSPSSPSFPSRPSSPSSPSGPSYPSGPSDTSSPSDAPSGGGDRSMSGFFLFVLFVGGLVILAVVLFVRSHTGLHGSEWETGIVSAPAPFIAPRRRAQSYPSLIAALSALQRDDPEFSFVLFEDFLYALYTEAHTARGQGRLAGLSPYLSGAARGALEALGQRPVQTVIVGGLRVEKVTPGAPDEPTAVVAVFEANYAELDPQGAEHAYYTSERWTLTRPSGAKSRPPARARVDVCPNCGAPLDKLIGGVCGYCNKSVDGGEHDWTVLAVHVLAREERPPILTGETEEVGTSDPTVVAPDVKERWTSLTARDPALGWRDMMARVDLVFRVFHEAWTKREPLLVRPYLSDNLFQAQLYWIDAYKRQHLTNRTDGAHVVSMHLCRLVSDARYDAVTVRVFATGRDFTVNDAGEVVGGSANREREYSEYWTLIRGVDRTGAPRVTPECPSCGAGLEVSMAGKCQFCGAKVTAGEFDWVLSRIEQDEVYEG